MYGTKYGLGPQSVKPLTLRPTGGAWQGTDIWSVAVCRPIPCNLRIPTPASPRSQRLRVNLP